MIRIDAAWFAVEPLDMRAGVDKALARVVNVFGEARTHHAYLFINKRANRMKVVVNDGFGLWLCARKLNEGSFIRAGVRHDLGMALSHRRGVGEHATFRLVRVVPRRTDIQIRELC